MRIELGKTYFNGKYCPDCGRQRVSSYYISEHSQETGDAIELALRDRCVKREDPWEGHHDVVTRHPISQLLHYEFPAEGMERYRWFIPFFLRPIERLLKEKGKIS